MNTNPSPYYSTASKLSLHQSPEGGGHLPLRDAEPCCGENSGLPLLPVILYLSSFCKGGAVPAPTWLSAFPSSAQLTPACAIRKDSQPQNPEQLQPNPLMTGVGPGQGTPPAPQGLPPFAFWAFPSMEQDSRMGIFVPSGKHTLFLSKAHMDAGRSTDTSGNCWGVQAAPKGREQQPGRRKPGWTSEIPVIPVIPAQSSLLGYPQAGHWHPEWLGCTNSPRLCPANTALTVFNQPEKSSSRFHAELNIRLQRKHILSMIKNKSGCMKTNKRRTA